MTLSRLFQKVLFPLALLLALKAPAQGEALSARTDYRNEVSFPVAVGSSAQLVQAAAIALYSGHIGDATNSNSSSLRAGTPSDGRILLTQSIIGQPVGVATAPFNLAVQGSGSVTPVPDASAGTNWFQPGQKVELLARPGRYYSFYRWGDGLTLNPRAVTVGPSNFHSAVFVVSNTVTLETNAVGGWARVARFGAPFVLLNGVCYSNNVVPVTNGTRFSLTLTNSFPGGSNVFSINGSGEVLFTNAFTIEAPFTIVARGLSADGLLSVPGDPVNTLSATTPGGGTLRLTSEADLFSGVTSVTLRPEAEAGWTFLRWKGDLTGAGTNGMVIMDQKKSVIGTFGTPMTTKVVSGDGTIQVTPVLPLYEFGQSVRLTAVPGFGSYFFVWGGSLNGVTDNPADFVVTRSQPTNGASFGLLNANTFSLTLFTEGDGRVAVSPAPTNGWFYPNGTVVTLTAIPEPGQSFTGWTGDTNYAGTQITVVMNASRGFGASFALAQPVFVLGGNNFDIAQDAGLVSVTVSNGGAFGGTVQFATQDHTATGGLDFVPVARPLTFTNGQHAQAVQIPILNHYLVGPPRDFRVLLTNPQANGSGTNASLAEPASASVTIHYNGLITTNGSLLTQALPGSPGERDGAIQVVNNPTNLPAEWRFAWETEWRTNGEVAGRLEPGGPYEIQFRDQPGYLAFPQATTASVTNGALTSVEASGYYATDFPGTAALKVVVESPLGTNEPVWRLFGERTLRRSGETVTDLVPGEYVVLFRTLSGYAAPQLPSVTLGGGDTLVQYASYKAIGAVTNTTAAPLSGFALIHSSLSGATRLPYAFAGQLSCPPTASVGSGTVVRSNVVLTAAHVVFESENLSFASPVFWSFQRHVGEYEPAAIEARGVYALSGYAAARALDPTNGDSTAESQQLDVAALYFTAAAARDGAFSGYLVSEQTPSEWLSGSHSKLLVGYPMDASLHGDTNVVPGKMHATPVWNEALTRRTNALYTCAGLLGYPGNSGGALCVLNPLNGIYYPAAIYVAESANGAVFRAIDGQVADLIYRAAAFGDNGVGTNSSWGVSFPPNTDLSRNPGGLIIRLGPHEAIDAGAQWRISGGSSCGGTWLSSGSFCRIQSAQATIQFKSLEAKGWDSPTNRTIALSPDGLLTYDALYQRRPVSASLSNLVILANGDLAMTLQGTTDGRYAILRSTNLLAPLTNWSEVMRLTNTSGKTRFTNRPPVSSSPQFYRAKQL